MSTAALVLVEDDDLDAMALDRALRREGLDRITRYRRAESALEALERTPATPAVLVVDIDLPGMSGLELLARISGDPALRSHPVFLLTGQDTPEKRRVAQEHRATGYVLKDPRDRDPDAELARFAHLLHSYLVVCQVA